MGSHLRWAAHHLPPTFLLTLLPTLPTLLLASTILAVGVDGSLLVPHGMVALPLLHPGHYNTFPPYLAYSLHHPFSPYSPNPPFLPYPRYSPDRTSLEGLEDPTIQGWPSSTLTLPPTQYEDCIFLWYFCTDHVAPGWPGNQGKCSGLLSYCANYVEDGKKGLVDRPFFIEKVRYSQVFWTGALSLIYLLDQ